MARRYYSSVAQRTTLTSDVNSSTTTIPVAAVTGWPSSRPYTIVIDPDTVNEELVEVTAISGVSLTVTRGVDGTTGTAHSSGAVVAHSISARDLDEPNTLVNLADAKGDLVAATAADTWSRLAVGTDGQLLTADAASAAGVKWATAPDSGLTPILLMGG